MKKAAKTLKKNAPAHTSHFPGRGERGWMTAPTMRGIEKRKNSGPNGNEPVIPVVHAAAMASRRTLLDIVGFADAFSLAVEALGS
jgi:hypothetical protein